MCLPFSSFVRSRWCFRSLGRLHRGFHNGRHESLPLLQSVFVTRCYRRTDAVHPAPDLRRPSVPTCEAGSGVPSSTESAIFVLNRRMARTRHRFPGNDPVHHVLVAIRTTTETTVRTMRRALSTAISSALESSLTGAVNWSMFSMLRDSETGASISLSSTLALSWRAL